MDMSRNFRGKMGVSFTLIDKENVLTKMSINASYMDTRNKGKILSKFIT